MTVVTCITTQRKTIHIHTYIHIYIYIYIYIYSVQSLSQVQLFATPWTTACQASLSLTISQNSPKFMFIELEMPSNHLILCYPLFLLPSILPSTRVFSSELAFHIRWLKFRSFNFSVSPSSEDQCWFPLGLAGLISLQSMGLSRVFSSTTIWKHQFFGVQPLFSVYICFIYIWSSLNGFLFASF